VARVLWRDAQGNEGSVELSAVEVQIGRAVDCAIRTDDAMVSRHHARIYWAGHEYVLEDLGSANGVFYQEQRVSRHSFKHGDAARCGSLWLRFVDMNPGAGPSGPVPQPRQPEPYKPASAGAVTPAPQYRPPTHSPPQPSPHRPPSGGLPTGPVPSGPSPADQAQLEESQEEVKRLKRRIEQLQTELRLYRGGRGHEVAKRLEELENENDELQGEIQRQKIELRDMEESLAANSSDARAARADNIVSQTAETVQALNDILSNLRINVMAAEGEFEQFSHQLPRASFELIREALRSSSGDVDSARSMLRKLRDLAD
jgi:hypothetical protein